MNKNRQGVLQRSKSINSLIHFLLLMVLCLKQPVSAQPAATHSLTHKTGAQQYHVSLNYSPDSSLQSKIADKISADIKYNFPAIIVSEVISGEQPSPKNNSADLVIGIGTEGISSVKKYFTDSDRLYISTAPRKLKLDTNKNSAVLYITQSYCRQIKFIKQLNSHWKTISILNSQKRSVDIDRIDQCANKYGLNIYSVDTNNEANLTSKVKQALSNSDVLLALPDSSIYNSKTVKNILLTSYRYRKPVIAFSRNFVTAGALASIHSSIDQVTESASELILHYFENDREFDHPVNYPQTFEISINRQVFRALELIPPNVHRLQQTLSSPDLNNQDKSR